MNICDELLHRLTSKTRIRSLFKDIGIDDMEKVIRKMNQIYEEKSEKRQAEEQQRIEKSRSVEEIKKVMEEKGLSLADFNLLQRGRKEGKRKRNVSKHNFEYKTTYGDTVRWYGSTTGRLPKVFQDYLEHTGKKRTDCIADD